MKKTISINISGVIFHIEEDGYDKLKSYLTTVQQYFSTYEDSQEIIADIEARIAEIFLGKVNAGKQVITVEDVEMTVLDLGTDYPKPENLTSIPLGGARPQGSGGV